MESKYLNFSDFYIYVIQNKICFNTSFLTNCNFTLNHCQIHIKNTEVSKQCNYFMRKLLLKFKLTGELALRLHSSTLYLFMYTG